MNTRGPWEGAIERYMCGYVKVKEGYAGCINSLHRRL